MKLHARPALLCFGALAALCLAAACGRPVTAPDQPAAALLAPADPAHTASTDGEHEGTTTSSDSVAAGYGTESTGGIEYETFEYDPETGTETVVTSDPEAEQKGMTTTTTEPATAEPAPEEP